jgi:hypothetical protein
MEDVQRGADGRIRLALGLTTLALAGALLAVLPHAIAWVRTGDPAYLPDADAFLYLAWSRDAVRHGAWQLSDGVHRPGEDGPMMHPWLLFIPPALLAHGLGLGMVGTSVLWRALGGAGIALGLYAAVRPLVRDARVALLAAALLVFDAGLLFGRIGLRGPELAVAALRGDAPFLAGPPQMMPHLRVVPPALAIPFLLGHFALVLHARQRGGTRRALAAGASFGLLFYAYFYFWTMVLAGSLLALVVDNGGRRLHATVLLVGLTLGAPALGAGLAVKRGTPPDWLGRTDKFVAIGHFDELLVPRLAIAVWAAAGVFVVRRRPELVYLWCTAAAGIACTNHQVVSGLQIENFHWIAGLGLTLSVMLAAVVLGWLPIQGREAGRARPGLILGALVVVQVALGVFLRCQEVVRTAETRWFAELNRSARRDDLGRGVPPGAVVAGEPDVLLWIAALGEGRALTGRLVDFSARVTDDELDERLVLNLFLLGHPPAAARRLVELPAGHLSWEAQAQRDPARAARQRAHRRTLIDRIWGDPTRWIAAFGVSHVVLPAARGSNPISPFPASLAARRTRAGFAWDVWWIGPATRG